jgi:EAL domain-containing protein (putative c-di-GMP-specific phosphodiesterase class I)/GGDEF domain-containing protein
MQCEPAYPVNTRADDGLRAERDRFVALAFCASDILIELDQSRTIVFAAGATAALLGVLPEKLVGRLFLDLVTAADREWVGEALRASGGGERIRNVSLRLEGTNGETPPMALVGYQIPDMGDRYYLSLQVSGVDAQALRKPASLAVTSSGLPDGQAFAEVVGARLVRLGSAAEMHKLTLMRLDGLVQLEDRLEKETRARLLSEVAGLMRTASLGGDSAGQLDAESFGLIHTTSFDTKALADQVRALARALDPDGEGVQPTTAMLDLDPQGMNGDEAAKACLYVFDRYVANRDTELSIKSLSAGLSSLIGDTVDRVQAFRGIVRDARFNMVFQPVVDLASRRTHHFEVLARFTDFGQPDDGTYQVITFAERTGLICDFDLAMCTKVLTWLDGEHAAGHDHHVAVNLSGRSIGSPAFVEALHRLLARHPSLRSNLLFEITESARIQDLDAVSNVVRGLRHAGHKVCLDDFGAGASAFHYLRAIEVDVVKIDGIYVRDALKTGKGQSFLKAMAGLCNDLGIATVAEMVESTNALAFLRACGVAYGQGYLFGRPSDNIRDFSRPKPPQEIAASPIVRDRRTVESRAVVRKAAGPYLRPGRGA